MIKYLPCIFSSERAVIGKYTLLKAKFLSGRHINIKSLKIYEDHQGHAWGNSSCGKLLAWHIDIYFEASFICHICLFVWCLCVLYGCQVVAWCWLMAMFTRSSDLSPSPLLSVYTTMSHLDNTSLGTFIMPFLVCKICNNLSPVLKKMQFFPFRLCWDRSPSSASTNPDQQNEVRRWLFVQLWYLDI